METIKGISSKEEMQKIIDEENEFLNADYTDDQIRMLIKKAFKLQAEDETFFHDRVYWWDTPGEFFSREKTVLQSKAKNYERVIERHLSEKDIDVNLFIKHFKEYGIKKHAAFISMICNRDDLLVQLSDENVKILCRAYNYFENEANIYNLRDRIRPLILNSTDGIYNLNDEVIKYLQVDSLNFPYLKNKYFSVLRDEDIEKIDFSTSDLLYIIKKLKFGLGFPNSMFEKLDILLEQNKDSVTLEVREALYKKLIAMPEHSRWSSIVVHNENNERFLFFRHFDDSQIRKIIRLFCSKNSNVMSFFYYFKNSVRDKEVFSSEILAMILDKIKAASDNCELNREISLFTSFVLGWKIESYSEENTRKLYYLLVEDTELALKMLNPATYSDDSVQSLLKQEIDFDFSFVKKYIIDPIQERRVGYILQLLSSDKKLNTKKVLVSVGRVINGCNVENIGIERVSRIVKNIYDTFFTWQTKESLNQFGKKHILDNKPFISCIALEFIRLRLFNYLDVKSQYFIMANAFNKNFMRDFVFEEAVVDNYFTRKQFDYIWRKIENPEKRMNIISNVYNKCNFEGLDDNTVRTFNDYIEYNINSFVHKYFVDKRIYTKPDFVVDYVSLRYPFSSATTILGDKAFLEINDWRQLFNRFYTDTPAIIVDELYHKSREDYLQFHEQYVREHNDVLVSCNNENTTFSRDDFMDYFFGKSEDTLKDDSLLSKMICPCSDEKRYVSVVQLSYNDLLVSSLVKDSSYPREEENDSEIVYTRITSDDASVVTVKQYTAAELSERVLDLAAESMPGEEFVEGYDYTLLEDEYNLANIYVSEENCQKTLEFTIKNEILARDFIGIVRERIFDIQRPTFTFKDCLSQGEGITFNTVNDDGSYYSAALKVKQK